MQAILNVIGGFNSHCLCLISNCLLIGTGIIYNVLSIIHAQYGLTTCKVTIAAYLVAVIAQIGFGFVLSEAGIKEFLNLKTTDDGKDAKLILFVGLSYMCLSLVCILLESFYVWESE